jgi:hypothetical protein
VIGLASRFLFLFLDGVGLGALGANNPLAYQKNLPFLSDFLGLLPLRETEVHRSEVLFKPIDARLGIPGLPQSATGQTSLYTGYNAPQFRGQHQTGFANGSLRRLIEPHGLFKRVLQLGGTATLANLYSPQYFYGIASRRIRYSVGSLLNLTAGLPFRMQSEYEAGTALFWDITGDLAQYRGIAAPPIAPETAGRRLAVLSRQYSVTLFESYLTDFAGHAQDWDKATQVLRRVDAFLASLIAALDSQTTLVISSDHGNLEDLSTRGHTLNAVPLIAVGPQAKAFSHVTDITGITPTILACLQQFQDHSSVGPENRYEKIFLSFRDDCRAGQGARL